LPVPDFGRLPGIHDLAIIWQVICSVPGDGSLRPTWPCSVMTSPNSAFSEIATLPVLGVVSGVMLLLSGRRLPASAFFKRSRRNAV
jgi:hypothetical protein